MILPEGQPILTVAAMRAAEDRVIAAGTSVETLMERAGAGVAEAVRRLSAGAPVLVLCGPGNNGGDGYVAARVLSENGVTVRVTACGEPKTDACLAARRRWDGAVQPFGDVSSDAQCNPVVVDALFGTGLSRPVERATMRAIENFVQTARLSFAVDVPSGVDSDTGLELNRLEIPDYSVTLALGALKPAHVLQPSVERCGLVRLIDIGLGLNDIGSPRVNVSPDETITRPRLLSPGPRDHKYSRGMVVVIGGAMPGASALAVEAGMRAGAGYGLLLGDAEETRLPHAVVRRPWSTDALTSAIAGKPKVAVVIGPGLGRDDAARAKLDAAIACQRPLVIDGDALHLLEEQDLETFRERSVVDLDNQVVLTPHAGEFEAAFGRWSGSKIEAARAAARRSGTTVVFKGADTVVAHPNGHTNVALRESRWLSTAGTGDVLAGVIGGLLPHSVVDRAAEAAVWIHAEAARRLGSAFIADDLVREISAVRATL